jgi:ribosomal protein L7/L12
MQKRLQAFLRDLEQAFEKEREDIVPLYPFDKTKNLIHLPNEIVAELSLLLQENNKFEAVKRVTQLTGAGLRLSKDYVDSLQRKMP